MVSNLRFIDLCNRGALIPVRLCLTTPNEPQHPSKSPFHALTRVWLRSLSKAREASGIPTHRLTAKQKSSPNRGLLLKWGCLGGPPVLKFKARPNFALHHEVLDPLILILDGKLIGAYLICLLLFLAVRIPHHSHRRL